MQPVCYLASFPGPRPASRHLQYGTSSDGKLGEGLGMRLCVTDIVCIAAFVSTPSSVNATLGSTATFICSANATRFSVVWLVNGSLLTELNTPDITAQHDRSTSILHIRAREEYNNTSVVCELTIRDSVRSIVLSDPAVLRVQGMFNSCM